MEQTNNILATENIRKLFTKMVIPSVISQLITLVYNMVDRIFIGHIPEVGSIALTGIGVCMPVTLIQCFLPAFWTIDRIICSPKSKCSCRYSSALSFNKF